MASPTQREITAITVLGGRHRDALGNDGRGAPLLRRVRFIYATPQLHAAAIEQMIGDRQELADGLKLVLGKDDGGLRAQVLAGACMTALDAALDQWQRTNGERSLAASIRAAFAVLEDPLGGS